MRAALLVLVALPLARPAMATGTVDCSIADANVALQASATVRDGPGGHFSRLEGKLDIKAKGDIPKDLRKLDLKLDDLTQRWLHGNDLKLRLYRDRGGPGPSAELDLVIEARRAGKDQTELVGGYTLTVAHAAEGEERIVAVRGRARCTVG